MFAINKLSAGGRKRRCKACELRIEKERRAKKIDEIRAYDVKRAKSKNRRQQAKKNNLQWKANNPLKRKAQQMVSNAIRAKKLVRKNCLICDKAKTHGHHDNYAKPLQIMWLCPVHHFYRHKVLNASCPW